MNDAGLVAPSPDVLLKAAAEREGAPRLRVGREGAVSDGGASRPPPRRMSAAGWALHLLSMLAALTIGTFGVLKLLALDEFATALASWQLLPVPVRSFATPAVPLFEVCVAAAWFVLPWRRRATIAMLVMLALLTGVYLAHVAIAKPPTCGCAGKIAAYLHARLEWQWTASRNVLIAVCLLGGLARTKEVGDLPGGSSNRPPPPERAEVG